MQFSTFLKSVRFLPAAEVISALGSSLDATRLDTVRDVLSRAPEDVWPVIDELEYTRYYYGVFLQDRLDALGLDLNAQAFGRACILHYTVRLTASQQMLLDIVDPSLAEEDIFALSHGDPAYSSVVFLPTDPAADASGARYAARNAASGVTARRSLIYPADSRYFVGSPRHVRSRLPNIPISTIVLSSAVPGKLVEATLDAFGHLLSDDLFVLITGEDSTVKLAIERFQAWYGKANLWAQTVRDQWPQRTRYAHLAVQPKSRLAPPRPSGHASRDRVSARPAGADDRIFEGTCFRHLVSRQDVADRADAVEILRPPVTVPLVPPKILLSPAKFAEQMRGNFAADIESWWRADHLDLPLALNVMFRDARLVGCGHCFTPEGEMFDSNLKGISLAELVHHAGVNRSDLHANEHGHALSRRAAAVAQVVQQPSIYIGNGGLPMHAHFLLDCVGRLVYLGRIGLDGKQVILPSIVTPAQLDDIARVYDIPRDSLKVYDEQQTWQFKELYVLPIAKLPPWLDPDMVRYLRGGLAKARFPATLDPAASKRLFVGRGRVEGGPRRLLNENELRDVLTQEGFIDVEPSDYTLEDEIGLFANAEEIVFIYGSSCANVAFCRPGTRVLILQSDAMTEKTFGMICGQFGIEYGYVFGSSYHRWTRGHNSDWVIDPNLVRSGLHALRDPGPARS
jgi:capsular polysaccharide biosynthesis protein